MTEISFRTYPLVMHLLKQNTEYHMTVQFIYIHVKYVVHTYIKQWNYHKTYSEMTRL